MSRLQDRRVWLGGGALTAVVIVASGWLAVISPQLSSASSLRDQAATVGQQNSVLQARVNRLKGENGKLGALTATLNQLLAELPFDSGLPALTRQLSSQAAHNQIALTSITVGSITPTTVTGAQPGGSGTTSAAGQTFAIPLTLVSGGSATHQLAFLTAIRVQGPRRALVASTQLVPLATSGGASIDASCTMTTQLTVFTAPLSADQQAQLKKLLRGDVSSP
jgi:hypothetical protein